MPVTETSLDLWFHDDNDRKKEFRKFLSKGCLGVVRAEEGRWISYAWMSPPASRVGPEQIPFRLRSQYYWIYYCRTREEYQGRGLYKESLKALVRDALGHGSCRRIMIDTEPSNIASRRAILSVGFIPQGVLYTKTLVLPWLKRRWVWGDWEVRKQHP